MSTNLSMPAGRVGAIQDVPCLISVKLTHTASGDACYCTAMVDGQSTPALTDTVWQVVKTDGDGKIEFPDNSLGNPDPSFRFPATPDALTFTAPV